ncbi:transglutaminase family protein [Nitriliruptoraceae bacterium ZYF776]|nr:transglutaminase family protein [Profundirhabdus halotolerans]
MKLDIRYVTRFAYDGPVVESQNELRACPASDGRQALLHYNVTTSPSSRVSSYVDFWGTRVDTFGVRMPHGALEVVAEATVETAPQPLLTASPRRAVLADPGFRDLYLEFLEPSPHADWGADVAAEARRRAELAGDDVVGAVLAVHRAVGELEYVGGRTYVGVSVDEVLAQRRGVCQDFAHLAVAMYRSLGIPARYVSGYFFTVDDATGAGGDEEEVHVETHAWVEVAIPTGRGDVGEVRWMALDPTNQQNVGERHVTIGRGRDYDDVAPFRGVFSGSSTHELEVNVTMRRLAVEPLEAPAGATLPRQRAAQQQ